jgi:1-deoxy-D-xylulose-5-phosphate synthase
VAILAIGRFVATALEAASILAEQGIQAAVWDMRWVKPIDAEAVAQASRSRLIVTLEEGTLKGGFADAVLEQLGHPAPPTLTLGLPDRFIPHGNSTQLFETLGLTAPQIATRICEQFDTNR